MIAIPSLSSALCSAIPDKLSYARVSLDLEQGHPLTVRLQRRHSKVERVYAPAVRAVQRWKSGLAAFGIRVLQLETTVSMMNATPSVLPQHASLDKLTPALDVLSHYGVMAVRMTMARQNSRAAVPSQQFIPFANIPGSEDDSAFVKAAVDCDFWLRDSAELFLGSAGRVTIKLSTP